MNYKIYILECYLITSSHFVYKGVTIVIKKCNEN